jgi:ribosomal protein S18 acetylase RimI-like enzyme
VAREIWRLRTGLCEAALQPPSWPDGIRARTFAPADGPRLHALLEHGYRNGGGRVPPLAEWLPATTGDAEFDPELVFLAESPDELAGAALCWTSGFLKDLAVRETWRRRGLGEALVRHVLVTFAARGLDAVDLKAESTNAGAVRLYERLGFRVIERLPASG